jgi:hypothetical protein
LGEQGLDIGLVGSGGTIATSYTYQPFGATTMGGSGNSNPYQFTGRENDGTGLTRSRSAVSSSDSTNPLLTFSIDASPPTVRGVPASTAIRRAGTCALQLPSHCRTLTNTW